MSKREQRIWTILGIAALAILVPAIIWAIAIDNSRLVVIFGGLFGVIGGGAGIRSLWLGARAPRD